MSRTATLVRIVLPVALVAFVSSGCGSSGKTTAPTPPPSGTLEDVRRLLESTVVPGTVLPTNADTLASLLATMDVDGLRAASASFVVGASLASAGTVSAAAGAFSVDLDRLSTLYGGNTEYAYTTLASHPLGVNLPFDGTSYHRFDVGGSATVTAFSDSIRSTTRVTLAAPASGATVPRASDLAVTWSNPGTDTTVYVVCAVTSLTDTLHVALGTLVRDIDGGTSIPAARLGVLPAGGAMLAVTRFRLAYHSIHSRKTGLACLATQTRALTLN